MSTIAGTTSTRASGANLSSRPKADVKPTTTTIATTTTVATAQIADVQKQLNTQGGPMKAEVISATPEETNTQRTRHGWPVDSNHDYLPAFWEQSRFE